MGATVICVAERFRSYGVRFTCKAERFELCGVRYICTTKRFQLYEVIFTCLMVERFQLLSSEMRLSKEMVSTFEQWERDTVCTM